MRTVAAALALCLSGCSFVFVEKPQAGWRESPAPPRCTSSKGWVYADDVLGVISGLTALAMLNNDTPEDDGAAIGPIVSSVLHLAGAIVGRKRVDQCRAAIDEWHAARAAPVVTPTQMEGPPGGSGSGGNYWCSVSLTTSADVSACAIGEDACVDQRQAFYAEMGMGACAEVDAVTCVDAVDVDSGKAARWCTATVAGCVARETALKADAAYRDVTSCAARSGAE